MAGLLIDLSKYTPRVKRIKQRLHEDTFKAVNLAAQVTAELLKQYTPRRTGQTARAVRVVKTQDFERKAIAGFFPGKGNTAYVARILEKGRQAHPGGRIIRTKLRDAEGRRILRVQRGASRMAPRPILARVLPLVPGVIREAFKRVFGPDWRPRK